MKLSIVLLVAGSILLVAACPPGDGGIEVSGEILPPPSLAELPNAGEPDCSMLLYDVDAKRAVDSTYLDYGVIDTVFVVAPKEVRYTLRVACAGCADSFESEPFTTEASPTRVDIGQVELCRLPRSDEAGTASDAATNDGEDLAFARSLLQAIGRDPVKYDVWMLLTPNPDCVWFRFEPLADPREVGEEHGPWDVPLEYPMCDPTGELSRDTDWPGLFWRAPQESLLRLEIVEAAYTRYAPRLENVVHRLQDALEAKS